jgi:hypothetical protein
MPDPLESARLKIARAREHIEASDRKAQQFRRSNPYSIVRELDTQTGEQIWRATGQAAVPPVFSIIIGDALHNLRAALDHLAWQLVLTNGQQPTTRTAFPIYDDSLRFDREGTTKLRGMSPAAVAAIKALQPCYGTNASPNRMLSALEHLDKVDKHRHLNLILVEAIGGIFTPGLPSTVHPTFIHLGRVEHGTVLARLRGEQVNVDVRPAIDIAFDERWPTWPDDAMVDNLLHGVADAVERIIADFQRDFF